MKRKIVYSVAVTLSLVLYGCGKPADSESATPTSSSTAAEGSDEKDHGEHSHSHADGGHEDSHGDHSHGDGDELSDMDKMKAALAKLSSEDAASAEKQHVCPVTGDMLGTMGAPLKVDVNGQQVWICCEGCRDPLLENPEEYLAKLDKE